MPTRRRSALPLLALALSLFATLAAAGEPKPARIVSTTPSVTGILLAMENIRLLMGEAPDQERQDSIAALARSVDGVESVHDLTARYDGTQLDVTLHVVVDEELSLRAAHDIAESVERRLMQERDILHAMVHVDVEPDEAT